MQYQDESGKDPETHSSLDHGQDQTEDLSSFRFHTMNNQHIPELSPEEALSLIEDGARLLGRMLVLDKEQISHMREDLEVIDLLSTEKTSIGEALHLGSSEHLEFLALPLGDMSVLKQELQQLDIHVHTLIGVTGTIGSGKSAASQILQQKGAVVMSADIFAREVVAPGSKGLEKIEQHFGSDYLQADGSLDRKKLGQLVFSDEQKRQELNHMLHPLIRRHYLEALLSAIETLEDNGVIAYEVPLLFESDHSHPELEEAILVTADRETCIERIMNRDSFSREEAEDRIKTQMPVSEKKKRATCIIENNGTLDDLSDNLEDILELIQSHRTIQ